MTSTELGQLRNNAYSGQPEAEYELGLCFEDGCTSDDGKESVPICKKKAFLWYKRASEGGHTSAMASLGVMFSNGEGCKKDNERALYWLKKSIRNSSKQWSAASNVAQIYWERRNFRRAFFWLQKAVEMGNSDALFDVGWCYVVGKGVRRDYALGRESIEQAIENTFISQYARERSMLFMGVLHYNGYGVEKSIRLAKSWCKKAVETFDGVEAEDIMARIEKGEEVDPILLAHKWWL